MIIFYNAPKRLKLATIGAIFLLVLQFSGSAFANENCQIVPIALDERTKYAEYIIEGEVLSQKSFWDVRHENIYTSNLIKIYKVFKGSIQQEQLEIITEGGVVGLEMHIFSSALKLKSAQQGIFFLTKQQQFKVTPGNQPTSTKAFGDQQGFISYNLGKGTAHDPFTSFKSVEEVYNRITEKTGIHFRTISENVQLRNTPAEHKSSGYNSLAAPVITSFSPAVASAGTGTILTINGSGFGNARGAGSVEFRNADDGGTTFIQPLPVDYVTWSDTQIRVRIPTAGIEGGTAGTGEIRVNSADGSAVTSTTQLTIPFSYINFEYEGGIAQPILVGMNSEGGYTLSYAPSMRAALAPQEGFRRAMNNWICSTNVNWQLDQGTSTVESSAADGISVIRFTAPSGEFGDRTLARTISRYQGCQNTQTRRIEWSVKEFDMEINSRISWQYGPGAPTGNQYDFETVVLHELGHAHQLGHVIQPRLAVMHYSVANRIEYRDLSAADIEGGNTVIANSLVPDRVSLATGCNTNTRPFVRKTNGDCSLAAEIVSFDAIFNASGTVDLSWTIQGGRTVGSFIVQRSSDGTNWEDIGTVEGRGPNRYTFVDTDPLPRTSYYRLRVMYTSGQDMFSYRVRVINPKDLRRLVVYPNPVSQSTQVIQLEYIVEQSSVVSIQLYDYTGKMHRDVSIAFNDLNIPETIDVSDLAAGMYILKWSQGNRSGQVKVVKL